MDNSQNLIPANSKKSMLILGFFNPTDLVIFLTGVSVTFLLLITFGVKDLKTSFLILAPALICSFLVLPIPQHHNIRTFIINVWNYFVNRKQYYWRGWCMKYGNKE